MPFGMITMLLNVGDFNDVCLMKNVEMITR